MREIIIMKKISLILFTILLVFSCKLLDRIEEDKADVIITLDYSQASEKYRLNKFKSDAFNVKSIDEAKLVVYDIDYSYSTVRNNYTDIDGPSSNVGDFENSWVTGVENELDDISNGNCVVDSRYDLTISNNRASGEFELDAGVKYFLVGLFENGYLHYLGFSNIIDLNAGDSKTVTITIPPFYINYYPTASFIINPTSGTTSTTFAFDASGSSDGHDATSALQVRWDWDNNGTYDTNYNTTKITTHQYNSDGTFTAKLEVKDTGGLTAETTRVVSVQQSNTIVTFPDANFEALIRESLNKPSTDISPSDMATLTELDGSSRNINNISGIEYCTNLTWLNLYENQIIDINSLSNLINMESLTLWKNQITNISSLSELTNLTKLDVDSNYINNLSAITSLTNLDTLWIGYNPISDISPVSHLYSLELLGIYETQISDISALSDLTNLSYLNLHGNQISDIYPLSGLTNLYYLSIYSNQISDISPLSGLTNLSYLHMSTNQISDISPLSGLTDLFDLQIWSNQISDISSLSGLTNLSYLGASQNQISDISSLSGLTNLSYLHMSTNQISDISSLSGLTNLSYLSIFSNQISDISALSDLTDLVTLSLGSNQISDIGLLSGLINLDHLGLYYNQISDISVMGALTNLTSYLSLGGNQINDISALSGLTELQKLYLYENQISDISALSDLTDLVNLRLEYNQISDIYPLVQNSGIDNGDEVNLENNPLSSTSINTYIPQLENRGVTVYNGTGKIRSKIIDDPNHFEKFYESRKIIQ